MRRASVPSTSAREPSPGGQGRGHRLRDARPAAHRFGLVGDIGPSLLPLGFGASGSGLGFGFGCPPFAMMRLPPFEEDFLPGDSTSEYAMLD